MDPEQVNKLPISTNAIKSYNRFRRLIHQQPLTVAIMATNKESMAKSLEIMARGKGLSTNYDDPSETA